MRTNGGEAEQLTSAKGGVENFKWSQDGKMIAFTARDAMGEEEQKKQKDRDDAVYVDHDYKYGRLWGPAFQAASSEQITC